MLYLRLDEIGEPVDDNRVNYGPLTVGTCDMSLPLATFEGSEIDPPYRLDPFQNIIQFSEEATATEAFMAVWIAPDAFGNQLSPASGNTGHWGGFTGLFKPNFPDHPLEFWYFNCLGGPLYDGAPHHSDLDMRFVDQFFDPKTYDNTGTGALGTSDVRGYTWSEWEQGFSPPPGYPTPGAPPAGLSGLWWYQLQAYIAANGAPPRTFPNMFDFTAYGFDGALAGPFTAWYNGVAAGHFPLEDGTNPTPVCAVRMAAIGSSTTDNPSGRY